MILFDCHSFFSLVCACVRLLSAEKKTHKDRGGKKKVISNDFWPKEKNKAAVYRVSVKLTWLSEESRQKKRKKLPFL